MGFVNEEASISKMNDLQKKDWEYLNELGVRTIFGDPIEPSWCDLVVDREKNYYLIPCGSTNPNRDNIDIHFFALCLDGRVVNMEVKRCAKGGVREKSLECHWKIEKIIFPKDWSFDDISKDEFEKIVIEAFTVEYYSSVVIKEWIKEITVEFTVPLEVSNEGKED